MATYIVGIVLAIALSFALKHIYNNFRDGHSDCCGSTGGSCNCGCSGCHSSKQ